MSYNLKGRFGYVSKCRGIPKYPGEFTVNLEKPDNVFMKEYNTIKCLLKQLEDKYSSSPSPTVNLFDLME